VRLEVDLGLFGLAIGVDALVGELRRRTARCEQAATRTPSTKIVLLTISTLLAPLTSTPSPVFR